MYRVPDYPPQPPRRSSSAAVVVLAGVAGFALLLAAGVSGALFYVLRRDTSRAPIPVATPATSIAAAPSGGDGSVGEPPLEALPPGEPGTPASSLKARPLWGKLDVLTIHAKPTLQYAPQLSDPLEVFLAGKPITAPVERAFVVCRVQSFGTHDTFGGDDLHVRATLGATPEIANDGPEDANLGFVSAPDVTMKPGESARFEVYDRDVFEMELVTRASIPIGPNGMSNTDTGATIECRQVGAEALGKAASIRGAVADKAVAALARHELDGRARDWGWPALEVVTAQRKIGDVAALVGWDDARAQTRSTHLDAANEGLARKREALFEALRRKATDDAVLGGVRAKRGAVACANGACTVTLSITDERDGAIHVGPLLSSDVGVYVATARGGPVDATTETASIAPKETRDVAFTANLSSGDEAGLVGVCVSRDFRTGCAPLRVR